MSKELFKPVDFDKLYPAEVEAPEDFKEAQAKPVDKAKVEEIVKTIQAELHAMSAGQSKLFAYAISYTPEKTPFCIALRTFAERPDSKKLIALAKQDFTARFADFVAGLVAPLEK